MRRLSSRLSYVSALLFAAACGGSSSSGGNVTPAGTHNHYVVSTITAPASQSADAIVHINPANGNPVKTGGTAVNKLGGLFSTLTASGANIQTPLTAAVEDGSITLLADFQTTDFTNAPGAGFEMFIGSDPNPAPCIGSGGSDCGQQFSGSASFDVQSDPGDAALAGPVVAGEFNGGPGDLTIEFSLATSSGGSGGALTINLKDALVQATEITATTIGNLVVGGAILETDIQTTLIPTVATQLNATVTQECIADGSSNGSGSACGSANPTQVDCSGASPPSFLCCSGNGGSLVGENSIVGLDANKDCVITAAELGSNELVMSLLSADVASTGNGKPDAVSFGIGATAVGAVYTEPAGD